jgi:type I restriction enzyme, S subunit
MRYPRYPAYKDSGVEWLGEVPAHWEAHQLRRLLVCNDGGVWGDEGSDDDTVVLRSTEQRIDGVWSIHDPARRKLTEQERSASLLREGDLVVTKSSGSSQHIGKTSYVTADIASLGCCFSNFMQRLRLQDKDYARWVFYTMNNRVGREQLSYLSSTTTGLANLNGTLIGLVRLAIPTKSEIRPILSFLDRETARLDTLIARQEQLIALLQEKRQALIAHAVTKGLCPTRRCRTAGWSGWGRFRRIGKRNN